MRYRAPVLLLAFTTTVLGLCALWVHRENEGLRGERERLREDLRGVRTECDSDLRKVETRLAELVESAARRDKELVAAVEATRERVDALAAAVTGGVADASVLSGRIEEIAKKISALSTGLDALKPDSGMKDGLGRLRSDLDSLGTAVRSLEQSLTDKLGDVARAAASSAEERKKLARVLLALEETLGHAPPSVPPQGEVADTPPPPPVLPIETSVEKVDIEDGIVVVGAGRRAGLEAGHILYVLREGALVARLRVLTTYTELSGAEILEAPAGMSPRPGDQVTTTNPAGADAVNGPPPEDPVSSRRDRIGPPPR